MTNFKHIRYSRRQILLMGAVATSGLLPLKALTDDNHESDHDDYDAEHRFANNSNSTYALANTGLTGNIIVVGGGMAGSTVAKYLRLWGGSQLNVTLVEPNATYTSNIMSNLVLNNSRTLSSLSFDYTNLSSKYGVSVKHAAVSGIDASNKRISLSDNTTLAYDRLILAPGIEFMAAYGLTTADYDSRTPHAWHAGDQTRLLRDQIANMPTNGTFVMTIPAKPYRCPPGPYERACLVADYLKKNKGSASRVIVLDENSSIQAEAENFTNAFNNIHGGVITYVPSVTGIQINASTKQVSYTAGGQVSNIAANVVNPIPPHRATGSNSGGWLANAGLNNSPDGRWCLVNPLSYQSTANQNIHVLGDASNCGLPKAGHVANQEAKICADAIVRLMSGQQPDGAPVANSACYSPITNTTASWLTAVYQYDGATGTMKVAANGGNISGALPTEANSITAKNFQQMNTWFNTLMSDSFS